MNNGKICVSVCAETADEFIEKIKRASEIADVIELRFDCLADWHEIGKTRAFLLENKNSIDKTILATLRRKNRGGQNDWLEISSELTFWGELLNKKMFDMEDLDFKLGHAEGNTGSFPRIRSFHSFSNSPPNLEDEYDLISGEKPAIIKIAAQTSDVTESLAVWKLLEKAKSENIPLIPIAMGEPGKWTRILGLAHGAPITYSSLEAGDETAPGQISVKDLIEVYRVKELDTETGIYGIIGNPVSHSLSPYMHNAAFKHFKLNAVYIPFEVSNLDEFIKRMVRPETREIEWDMKGFSVTIPHKQTILAHLDFIDDAAKEIGAVNTVKIIEGKLHGFNTDADGFVEPLRNAYENLENANVGIIGNGGAARSCIYALRKEGTNITIFARNTENARRLSNEFEVECLSFNAGETEFIGIDVLVNASPLGMKGELETQTPGRAEQLKNLHLAYDLVYNPKETLFLREAESVGIPTLRGIEMLISQGARQFEVWTGCDAPIELMKNAAVQRLG